MLKKFCLVLKRVFGFVFAMVKFLNLLKVNLPETTQEISTNLQFIQGLSAFESARLREMTVNSG